MMNKTAASVAQLAKCILLHAFSHTTASSQQKKLHSLFNKLAHNSIFGYKLRTD